MFGTIVVGVDGRQGGQDALVLAGRMARPGSGEILAVNAYPFEEAAGRASMRFQGDLKRESERLLERATAAAGVGARPVPVADFSPARALHRVAERESAGLTVVGSTHHGPLGRVLVGDVAAGTLSHAPCPVAVAPRGLADRGDGEIERIGVGFDGSAESREALRVAAELARAAGSSLVLLHVVAPPTAVAAGKGDTEDWAREAEEFRGDAERLVREAAEGHGVEAVARTAVGMSAAEAIADMSRTVDLIVVGSRGWGPVRRLLIGGTAERLVREASGPVLVVPRAAATGQPGEQEPPPLPRD